MENDEGMKRKELEKGLEEVMKEGVGEVLVKELKGGGMVGRVGEVELEVME